MDDLATHPMPVPAPLPEDTFSTIADPAGWTSMMADAHIGSVYGLDRKRVDAAFRRIWMEGRHTSAPALAATWNFMSRQVGMAKFNEELSINEPWTGQVFTTIVPVTDCDSDKGIRYDKSRGQVRIKGVGAWNLLSKDEKEEVLERVIMFKGRRVIEYMRDVCESFIEMNKATVVSPRSFMRWARQEPHKTFYMILGCEFGRTTVENIKVPSNVVIITQTTLRAVFAGDIRLHDIAGSAYDWVNTLGDGHCDEDLIEFDMHLSDNEDDSDYKGETDSSDQSADHGRDERPHKRLRADESPEKIEQTDEDIEMS